MDKNIKFKTSMLRLDLCDYSDVYIVVKRTIDLLAAAAAAHGIEKTQKNVAFKNNAPFRSCISKINSTLIDNAEDLDIVMSMYNLLEYSHSYFMTSGSLWKYFRDEIDNVDDNASDDKSLKNKTKIVGQSLDRPPRPPPNPDGSQPSQPEWPPQPPVLSTALNVEVTIPLKYLSFFFEIS